MLFTEVVFASRSDSATILRPKPWKLAEANWFQFVGLSYRFIDKVYGTVRGLLQYANWSKVVESEKVE